MKQKILLIDDNPLFSEAAQRFFARNDVAVAVASAAPAAMAEARAQEFHGIFVDYSLPQTDGISLIRDLQKFAPRTPIFLITASWQPAVEKAAAAVGVRKVFFKPFSLADLAAALPAERPEAIA